MPGTVALPSEAPWAYGARYGFSPVCVRSCHATAFLSLKPLGHIEQAYGFSPVWVRSCGATTLLLLLLIAMGLGVGCTGVHPGRWAVETAAELIGVK